MKALMTDRFVSQDRMGFRGGDTNLYRYVGNNPVNATDPSGLAVQDAGANQANPWQQFQEYAREKIRGYLLDLQVFSLQTRLGILEQFRAFAKEGASEHNALGAIRPFNSGDIRGTFAIDASTEARLPKEPPRQYMIEGRRLRTPAWIYEPATVGVYFEFTDAKKDDTPFNGKGERMWVPFAYVQVRHATLMQLASNNPVGRWFKDGPHQPTNNIHDDFITVSLRNLSPMSEGIVARSFRVLILIRSKKNPSLYYDKIQAEIEFSVLIYWTRKNVYVAVDKRNIYGAEEKPSNANLRKLLPAFRFTANPGDL